MLQNLPHGIQEIIYAECNLLTLSSVSQTIKNVIETKRTKQLSDAWAITMKKADFAESLIEICDCDGLGDISDLVMSSIMVV